MTLLEKLQSALVGKPDVIPEGFLTRKQWEEKWGFSEAHTLRLLRIGVAKGLMEQRILRAGKRPAPHYKETGSSHKKR